MNLQKKLIKQQPIKQQSGFVLILALVMLSVMTIIGVSSMNSANIELKATANIRQHQDAYNGVQSMLEFAVSKDGETNFDYQTATQGDGGTYTGTVGGVSGLTATASYIGCTSGIGSSLEEGKGFGYGHFTLQADGTNNTGTASSTQVQGARYPSAAC